MSTFRPLHHTWYRIIPANNDHMSLAIGKDFQSNDRLCLVPTNSQYAQQFIFAFDQFHKTSKVCCIVKDQICCLAASTAKQGSYLKCRQILGKNEENWFIARTQHRYYTENEPAYTFQSSNGFYLDIENQKAENGKKVLVWSKAESLSQIWKLVPVHPLQ